MDKNLDRRGSAIRTSLAVGSLAAGGWIKSRRSIADEPDPSDKRLLLLGLNALARAHEMDYFAEGHRGATILSAHL